MQRFDFITKPPVLNSLNSEIVMEYANLNPHCYSSTVKSTKSLKIKKTIHFILNDKKIRNNK